MINIRDVQLMTGDSIIVRPFRREDVDSMFEAVRESVPEMGRWLPWCRGEYSRADSDWWIRSRSQAWRDHSEFSFAIEERATGLFAGGCGLNRFDEEHRCTNLGYWIRSSRTGCGYASEAAYLLARFAFTTLGLQRVCIYPSVENIASRRVAEKIGAIREGRLRNRLYLNGHTHDAWCYSLIPADLGLDHEPADSDEF